MIRYKGSSLSSAVVLLCTFTFYFLLVFYCTCIAKNDAESNTGDVCSEKRYIKILSKGTCNNSEIDKGELLTLRSAPLLIAVYLPMQIQDNILQDYGYTLWTKILSPVTNYK